jgi:hypothetical protein
MTPWLEDESVPDEVRRLLAVGAVTRPLEGTSLLRSRRRVAALAAVPVAAGAFFWAQQLALGAALGVAVSVGAVAVTGGFKQPSAPASAQAPSAPRPSKNVAQATPRLEPSAPALVPPVPEEAAPARAAERRPAAEASARIPESVVAEAQLLEHARRALGSDPTLTLAMLDEHARRFPKGTLVVEREVLAVDALVRAGRRAEAERRAARLRAASPGSLYETRLGEILK